MRFAAAAVVTAVIASTGIAFVVADDDPTDVDTTSTTVDRKSLGPEARELLDLLERQRKATYHARYAAASPDLEGGAIRIETWQSPPRIRQDSEVRVAGQLAKTTSLALPGGAVRCTQIGDDPWQCRRVPAGQPTGAEPVSAQAVEQLRSGSVSARDTTIGGRAVRCFGLSVGEQSSELCLTGQGVTVRVSAGGSSLELAELETEVDDAVFEPPAPVAPA